VRRVVKVPYANLINLLLDREVVPELIQEACRPEIIAAALRALLGQGVMPTARARHIASRAAVAAGDAAAQRAGFAEALATLHPPGLRPSEAAAEAVLELLRAPSAAGPTAPR
jgi:lipid-A-disaccharide synthase